MNFKFINLFLKVTTFRRITRNFNMAPRPTSEILKKLRDVMKNSNNRLHAYVIPSGDAHQNEYIASCDERRAFVSGFTGSAGTAVVSENEACLWTDGRYFLAAQQQMDSNWTLMKEGLPDTPTYSQFLETVLPAEGGRVGVDPSLLSYNSFERLSSELQMKGHVLTHIEGNLVDAIWEDRPMRTLNAVDMLSIEYTGKSWQDKVRDLRQDMVKEGCSAVVITSLDEIAWLFNLRGSDIEYNPVFFSYSILTSDSLFLFLDESSRLQPSAVSSLEGVTIHPYDTVNIAVSSLLKDPAAKIWIHGESSYYLVNLIPKKQRLLKPTPIGLKKAIKTEKEIEAARRAHVRDAVSLCEFFCWLSNEVGGGRVTEISAADKLYNLRSQQDAFAGPSFETISGSGPNGAIVHYKPTADSDRQVTSEEIYLCDSGAQYRDGGTTDVTRTVHFGTPTAYEKMCYTLVLKGHIAVSSAVFPPNLPGCRLDSFARGPLWEHGLDYIHGTGHGVGAYLCVHEGPAGIHYRNLDKPQTGLQPGMILSIEPGVYIEDKFGIRLENLAVVKETANGEGFLAFEPLTLVPFQAKLIDPQLLTQREVQWINNYHETCREVVGKALSDQGKVDAFKWLLQETAPLG